MTPEQAIAATRQHFADNALACIAEAESGAVRVGDLSSYIAWRRESARAALAGEHDHTFTFRQHAHYLQTGECVGLLGNG
jgi:hypothetical protein